MKIAEISTRAGANEIRRALERSHFKTSAYRNYDGTWTVYYYEKNKVNHEEESFSAPDETAQETLAETLSPITTLDELLRQMSCEAMGYV